MFTQFYMQELALAQSASDIAVAEVHSKDRRSITGGNEEFLFKDITIATTPLKRMGLEEESITKMIAYFFDIYFYRYTKNICSSFQFHK